MGDSWAWRSGCCGRQDSTDVVWQRGGLWLGEWVGCLLLDVGADPHLLRRADDRGHPTGTTRGEQPRLLLVIAGFVDESHLFARDTASRELVAQLVVGVPALRGGGEVTEHDLQRA
jgi:hypothetical protein